MITFGQITDTNRDAETQIAAWVILGLCACGIWASLRRFFRGPKTPDPWGEAIAVEIESESATPLCHRCLTPHRYEANFCPECGAAVGECTNLLPFPYLFSIGHTLRIGTSGEFKRSKLTVIGFFLFSIVEYAVFAPVYWFFFLLKLPRRSSSRSFDPQPPVSNPG